MLHCRILVSSIHEKKTKKNSHPKTINVKFQLQHGV